MTGRPSADSDAPIVVNLSTSQWLAQLAEAWDKGHRGLCRVHHLGHDFEACRNPYSAAEVSA